MLLKPKYECPKDIPRSVPWGIQRGVSRYSSNHYRDVQGSTLQSIPWDMHKPFFETFPGAFPKPFIFFFVPSSFIPVCVDVTHLHQAGFIYLKQSDLLTCIGIMILLRNSTFMLFNKTINFFNYLDLLIIFFCGI